MEFDAGLGEPRAAGGHGRRWLVIFALFALLYLLTAQHGPAWQDSGMHQLRALRGEFHNPLGLALAHPLLIAVAQPLKWIFGRMAMATALNMVCGVAMAVAVANVWLLLRRLGASNFAATAAASMLGVAHTAWWLATITESYAGVCAGLTTELIILQSLIQKPTTGKLCLLAAVNGLGWSLHNFFLLPLPVYLAVVLWLLWRRELKCPAVVAALLCWLIGGGLFLGLIVHRMTESGEVLATINSALFGRQWQQNVLGVTRRSLTNAGLYFLLNFPWIGWLLILAGLRELARGRLPGGPARGAVAAGPEGCAASGIKTPINRDKNFIRALGAVGLIELLFAVRYDVPDQFMFLLPAYCPLAVGAGLGLQRLLTLSGPRARVVRMLTVASIVLTPVLYAATPPALNAAKKSIRPNRDIPCRNENRYWISPWKLGERSAVRLGTQLLELSGPDAILVPGDTLAPPILYLQEAGPLRPDVLVAWLDEPRFMPVADSPAAWLAAAKGREVDVLKTRPSPAPVAVTDAAVSLEDNLLYRITPASLAAVAEPDAAEAQPAER